MLQALRRTYIDIFRQHPVMARLALVGACVGSVYALINGYALPLYLRDDLGLSTVVIGWMASTFLAAEMLMKFPLGHLSDRVGRRPLIAAGPAVSCVTALIIPLIAARHYRLLFPLRAIDGIALAAVWPAAFALVTETVPAGSRTCAMSVMWTVYMAGLGIGPALAGPLMAAGDRFPFYLASGVLALATAIACCGLPTRRVAGRPLRAMQVGAEPREAGASGLAWADRAGRPLALILLVTAMQLTALTLLQPFLPLYAVDVLHLSKAKAPLLFVVPALLVAGLGLPMGRLSDHWGKARSVKIAMTLAAVAMAVLPLVTGLPVVLGVVVVLMVAYLLGMPAWLALIGDLAPAGAYGGALGAVATAQGVGATIGPAVGGHLWLADYHYCFWASAGLLALCAALAFAFLPGGGAEPALSPPKGFQPAGATEPALSPPKGWNPVPPVRRPFDAKSRRRYRTDHAVLPRRHPRLGGAFHQWRRVARSPPQPG
jgi:DHA1 family multidrug resistance protein-like MFS transporter